MEHSNNPTSRRFGELVRQGYDLVPATATPVGAGLPGPNADPAVLNDYRIGYAKATAKGYMVRWAIIPNTSVTSYKIGFYRYIVDANDVAAASGQWVLEKTTTVATGAVTLDTQYTDGDLLFARVYDVVGAGGEVVKYGKPVPVR